MHFKRRPLLLLLPYLYSMGWSIPLENPLREPSPNLPPVSSLQSPVPHSPHHICPYNSLHCWFSFIFFFFFSSFSVALPVHFIPRSGNAATQNHSISTGWDECRCSNTLHAVFVKKRVKKKKRASPTRVPQKVVKWNTTVKIRESWEPRKKKVKRRF